MMTNFPIESHLFHVQGTEKKQSHFYFQIPKNVG